MGVAYISLLLSFAGEWWIWRSWLRNALLACDGRLACLYCRGRITLAGYDVAFGWNGRGEKKLVARYVWGGCIVRKNQVWKGERQDAADTELQLSDLPDFYGGERQGKPSSFPKRLLRGAYRFIRFFFFFELFTK